VTILLERDYSNIYLIKKSHRKELNGGKYMTLPQIYVNIMLN
jgi:hypothetical protein